MDNQPVFVIGERPAAMELVRALAESPTLCAMPANRLLADLVSAADRCRPDLEALALSDGDGHRPPAGWYREVQAARTRITGKARTVEFSGLPVLRLCELFPSAQFVVVHPLTRAIPPSRRLPALRRGRILEVDSSSVAGAATLERVLAFLGEPAAEVELDLSDRSVPTSS